MKNGRKTSIVSRMAVAAAVAFTLGGADVPGDAGKWAASPDLLTTPAGEASRDASFTLTHDAHGFTINLEYRGRTFGAAIPAATFVLPLPERTVRLRDPWVSLAELESRKPLANQGWNVWGGRPVTVRAAASGVVRTKRIDPVYGPVVEIDHGSGLLTRYILNRYGTSTIAVGTRVSGGDAIGELGKGLPNDIPFVHFGILLEAGKDELIALDPAPFFFASASNRALPFATSVLNAAVRSKDTVEVSRLIGLGLNPNGKAVDDTSPLEWAVMMRDAGMVRQLVAAGGDKNTKTAEHTGYFMEGVGITIANTGPTILEYAQESEDPDLVAALSGN